MTLVTGGTHENVPINWFDLVTLICYWQNIGITLRKVDIEAF